MPARSEWTGNIIMKQIWKRNDWRSRPEIHDGRRAGLHCRIDREVDPRLRRTCLAFFRWLRREYPFPVRVCVYLKRDRRIRARDGECVCGTFWWPYDIHEEPYVRIAAGDFAELRRKKGEEEAVREILLCIAHELTHYYQWLNDIKLTERGEERQASMQSKLVVSAYLSQRREHASSAALQNLSYLAIFRFDSDGINISFPDLPGCLSCAFSKNQAVPMAEEALSLWLSGMEYSALPPPSPVDLFTCRANESAHEIAVSVRVKDGIIE